MSHHPVSAVTVMGTITPIVELPIAEQVASEAALAAAYGGPAPLAISRRLARDERGTWLLSYRVCTWSPADFRHRVLGEDLSHFATASEFDPARHTFNGLEMVRRSIETRHAPIAEALAIIAAPDGPEALPRRLDRLLEGHDAWAAAQLARAAADFEKQREQVVAEEKARVEFRFDEWQGLYPIAQALYALAAEVERGATLPHALRTIAASANNPNPRFAWPRRKWW